MPTRRLKPAIPQSKVSAFCRRWKITEFSLFGSILRDDFGPKSDVDVLVTFSPGAPWGLFDLMAMQDELEALFGRSVDLVETAGLRNPFRRHAILSTRRVLYAARQTGSKSGVSDLLRSAPPQEEGIL